MLVNRELAGGAMARSSTSGGAGGGGADAKRADHLLARHRPLLLDAAREYLRRHPAVPLAALVLDTNDEEARSIAGSLMHPGSRLSVALVEPRARLAPLLRRHAAAHWTFRDDDPDGPRRPLPILVVTRAAVRFDVAWYPAVP
jgi:hypothetical protein